MNDFYTLENELADKYIKGEIRNTRTNLREQLLEQVDIKKLTEQALREAFLTGFNAGYMMIWDACEEILKTPKPTFDKS